MLTLMRGRLAGVALLVVLASTADLGGVGQPPQTRQTPPTTFRGGADAVFRNVIVRDARGRFVYNLTSELFDVSEDGVPQTITSFREVRGGRFIGDAAPARNVPPPAGVILPPARTTSDLSGRLFIIFIDDLHILHRDTVRAREVLKAIRDLVVDDADLVGIVSSGYSSIAVNLLYDYGHARLNEAIAKTMGSGMSPYEIINAAQTSQGPAGLRFMAHTAFRTVHDLLEQAQTLYTDRRKIFLYLSSGYDFDPFQDSRLAQEQERYGASTAAPPPFTGIGNQFSEAELIGELGEIIRAANRAGVTFFTIDPRGLVAGPDIGDRLSAAEHRAHIVKTTSALRALADNTGGRCICDTNDFRSALSAIDNETSDYYSIGYQSTNRDPQQLVRRVTIAAKRPGLTLTYPTQYTLKR
jgi:VWFA-related protein